MLNELALLKKDRYYHEVLKGDELIKLLELDFARIEECSDKYSQWFTNGLLTIDKGTWLDRPEFYLRVYGQNESSITEFVASLKKDNIIA